MPRIDFGHFYRFLVSAGLFMVAAGIALPWFVLRELNNSLPTQTQYDHLTDSARELADLRLAHLDLISRLYPFVSIGAAVIGLGIAVFGFLAWRKRQKVNDERDDLKLKRDRLEDEASEREINQKQEEEHQELAEEEAESDDSSDQSPEEDDPDAVEPGLAEPTQGASGVEGEPGLGSETFYEEPEDFAVGAHPTSSARPRLSPSEVAEIEDFVLSQLATAMGDGWELARNVKRAHPELGEAVIDALLRPRSPSRSRSDFPSIAVEVKYSRVGTSRARVSDAVMTLARVTRLRRREQTAGLLIYVIDERYLKAPLLPQLARVEKIVAQDVRLLRAPVGVIASGLNYFVQMDGLENLVLKTVFDALHIHRSSDWDPGQ